MSAILNAFSRVVLSLEYAGMLLTVEMVTPEIAADWLKSNKANRRLRTRVYKGYARAMEKGNWHAKPVALCFKKDGTIGNGQHTLHAIVESKKPQLLLIARNVSDEAIASMDVGLTRSITDIANFLQTDMGKSQAAIARILEYGVQDTERRSWEEVYSAYRKHEDAIDFALGNSREKQIGMNAAVLSVVARAWHTQDRNRVAEFLRVLDTGVCHGDADTAAIRLRDFLRSIRGSSTKLRLESYRKTQSALWSFLQYQPMTKVYGTERELFPIPETT